MIFFAITCLILNVSAQDAGKNTTNTDRVGLVFAPKGRNTMSLLQSCLVTLLSCTYTVLHLNIPAPHENLWGLYKRKLKWTFITLIAPEITCSVAFRQWEESRAVVKEMRRRGINWSPIHGFYATMGGFVLHHSDGSKIPLLPSEILVLLDAPGKSPLHLPSIKEIDIEDRNKTSGFTKLFTLTQVTWLVGQCILRGASKLPISQLEVTTVAFAACTIMASGFWWSKPLDVRMTTPVHYSGPLPREIVTITKGWKTRAELQRVKMTTRIVRRGSRRSMFFNLALPFFLFSTVFSVLHLIAWDFDFATVLERDLWRVCSLVATFMPVVIAGFLQMASIWDSSINANPGAKRRIKAPEFAALVILFYFLSVMAYVAARVILIFQVFYSLRSMPVGIYNTIPWTNYIPHV
jgi:hypothetical protein